MLSVATAQRFRPDGLVSRAENVGAMSIHPSSLDRHAWQGLPPHTGMKLTVALWTMPEALRGWFQHPVDTMQLRTLVRAEGPWDLAFCLGRAAPEMVAGRGGVVAFAFSQESVARTANGTCQMFPNSHVQVFGVVPEGIGGVLVEQQGAQPQGQELFTRAVELWDAANAA